MKRKIFTAALTLALTAGICSSVHAAKGNVVLQIDSKTMKVDGAEQQIDTAPVIIDNRTFVPVRAVVEALGGTADWNAETKTALLDRGDIHIELTIGSKTALLNSGEESIDTAPVIIDGRTMLPLRFIAENFGFYTDWDPDTKTIYVSRYDDVDPETNLTYELERIGTDGNRYLLSADKYVVVDENGNTLAEYTDTSNFSYKLTDIQGKKYTYLFEDERTFIVGADGSKNELFEDGEFTRKDKDGNEYEYAVSHSDNAVCSSIIVTDPKGEIVNKYYESEELRFYYKDKAGRDVIYVHAKDDTPDDGMIFSDGSFMPFERDYSLTYVDDDDNFYSELNGWFLALKKTGGTSDEAKMTDYYDIYTDEHGNQYLIYYNEGKAVIEYPDGKVVALTAEKEEKSVEDTENGKQDFINTYYKGTDGKTYCMDSEVNYIIEEADGKKTTLVYDGYVYEYTNKDGGIYKTKYTDSGKLTLTKPNGKTVTLVQTYG